MIIREEGRPVLAMIESNTTGTGRTFAVAARARGLRPVLLTCKPERYPWVAEDDVDVVLTDTTDDAAVADVARASAAEARLAGLVTSSEYFVVVTASATYSGFTCRFGQRSDSTISSGGKHLPTVDRSGPTVPP